MTELRPLLRTGPQPQALHFSYEKAGLVLHDAAIPWNADAVLVEASLRLPPLARRKADFSLRVADGEPAPAEQLRPDDGERHRLFFRLPVPARSTAVELWWREHSLGQLTLPLLSCDDFLRGLRLDMPTFFARVGNQSIACQTFVATQCHGFQVSGLLASRTSSLAPLADIGLHVVFLCEKDGSSVTVPVPLTGAQLQARQALVAAIPRKLPRRTGNWTATWWLGDTFLAIHRVKAISERAFVKSLRISDTRYVVVDGKQQITMQRQLPPLSEVSRIGPCFLISSCEPGIAGQCPLQVHAQLNGAVQAPVLMEQELLLTDGPTLCAPGTMDVRELEHVAAFELRHKGRVMGMLALSPVPSATFTSEGGFKPPAADFLWTSAADDELSERLNKLINEK